MNNKLLTQLVLEETDRDHIDEMVIEIGTATPFRPGQTINVRQSPYSPSARDLL